MLRSDQPNLPTAMNGSHPLPPVLSSKLAEFRRRVWVVKLAEGILAALFGLAISYLFVLALDRFFETPAWLRGLFLLAGAIVPGLGLPLKWHKWVWRQRRLEDAARLLRHKFPRLGDQLLGIVELAKEDSKLTGRSERLVQAAMAQADEAVKDQDFTHAVPRAKHRQWAWAAAGATAVVAAGFVTINDAARNAFVRWLMPWKETERYTFARVEELPNPLVVPLAESFTLPVNMLKESEWKAAGATASIDGQPEVSAAISKIPGDGKVYGSYELNFPPQKSDAEIFVKVGDVRKTIEVQPRPRPELKSLNVKLKLPDYLQYKTEPVTEVRGDMVSVLKGAQATFEATASRTLATAEIDGAAAQMDGERIISAPQPVDGERKVTFTWKDSLGLTAKVPLVVKVQPAEDEAPKLAARRETQELVVLDSEVVVFEMTASDDFGVKQMGLEWQTIEDGTKKEKTKGSKVASAGEPEKKSVESRATFCATREGVAPQSLELRAWAEDYLPGRERSRSASFVLHVLNQTDHALWVTQQMNKWLEAAKETYEREQQLHVTNKELRAMEAADLDRPENRRKVAAQAAAENSNGERLNSLTDAGRNLAEQATKNPEFDAARLESWATMLQSLDDIAKNRMPSVADLLKQSAAAKADAKMAQNSPGGQPSGDPNAKPGESSGQQGQPGEPQKPGDQSQTAKNSTNSNQQSNQNPNAKQGVPEDSKSAPSIAQGPQPPQGNKPPSPVDPKAKPVEKAPSIQLTESTMNKPEDKKDEKAGPPKPPSPGKLGLPSNSLAAGPSKKSQGDQPPPESSAQENLDQGIQEQKDLLAEFARVSDQLSEILASLEASTFVKRLKAASREQQQLAGTISEKTLDAFGIVREPARKTLEEIKEEEHKELEQKVQGFVDGIFGKAKAVAAANAAKKDEEKKPEKEAPFVTTYAPLASSKAKTQSDVVKVIQSDLEAYTQRKPEQYFKKVLGEMKSTKIISELKRVGERAADNLSGNAIHGAEYWADTLDRWAEEMVKAAGKCSNCSSCKGDSLPPEIVLKVMQALRDEMKLRDETRELENSKAAVENEEFASRARKLGTEQDRIKDHTDTAIGDIEAIEGGRQKFGKEINLLTRVVEVMGEASGILREPDTGAPAIAAETEAIELLLETKRQNPNAGGGGGANPGGGGSGTTRSAALASLGPGGDPNANIQTRPVGQATGRAGREFPEEFRSGLDAYFSNLEGTGKP
jgi:hypothetical protein